MNKSWEKAALVFIVSISVAIIMTIDNLLKEGNDVLQ